MSRKMLFAASAAVMALGLAAWIFQLLNGLVITNMSNLFNWGLYIGCFVFLVGVAAGGMIISSCIYLFNIKLLKPFGKIASLSAFACALGAGTMVIVDLGSVQNILNIFIHPNFSSPLVWDVIVISCYIVLTFLSVYFQLLPDCKERGLWFFNGWVRKASEEKVLRISQKGSRRVALIGLPFAVLIHTVTALIFATQNGHEYWHTAMLPPDFIAMAVASGGSLVLLLAMGLAGRDSFTENLGAYRLIAKIAATGAVVHFFFVAMELILLAWTSSFDTLELLGRLFGTYGILYAIELVFPFVALVMFYRKSTSSSAGMLITASVLMLIGTLAHRFMLLFPELSVSHISLNVQTLSGTVDWLYPVSTGRFAQTGMAFSSMYAYVPTGAEYLVALLPIGLTLTVLAFMALRYPLVSQK